MHDFFVKFGAIWRNDFLQKLVEYLADQDLVLLSMWAANLRSLKKGKKFRFQRNGANYKVSEGSVVVQFTNWSRGAHVYRAGVESRIAEIVDGYCLHSVTGWGPGVIVDIGANYGDFTRAIQKFSPESDLVLFEPVPMDASNLNEMFPEHTVHQVALSNRRGHSPFHLSTKGGDSSLFEPVQGVDRSILVEIAKLDDYQYFHSSINLVKIEAEGAEPEIIEGGNKTLAASRYVVVDGGPERGKLQEPTLDLCRQLLARIGFKELTRSRTRPNTVLFANTRISQVPRRTP